MADSEYVHGTMDISEQRKTFARFWTITKWSGIVTVVVLVFLALTRTTAYDCSKSDVAAAHLNACGKLPPAEGASAE
ncbi:MAG: aa3-type cytochrome c oxidase subunit IV [Alphaproteobacteria bacterium]|nr:aa3-type cytochrome c oxidase subunit IV [Alphaproteobacteria bacterium]